VRWIASVAVALCLLAAGHARARDLGPDGTHGSRIDPACHALAAVAAPRRDVGRIDSRGGSAVGLGAFALPAVPRPPIAPQSQVAIASDRAAPARLKPQVCARCSRGPPGD
jgi:hypothetical protein